MQMRAFVKVTPVSVKVGVLFCVCVRVYIALVFACVIDSILFQLGVSFNTYAFAYPMH